MTEQTELKAPVTVKPLPRLLRLELLLNNLYSWLGWGWLGLIALVQFFLGGILVHNSLWDPANGHDLVSVHGMVTNVEDSGLSRTVGAGDRNSPNQPAEVIIRYRFIFPKSDYKENRGYCYITVPAQNWQANLPYKQGDDVTIRYPINRPALARIENMRYYPWEPSDLGTVAIAVSIGLLLLVSSLIKGINDAKRFKRLLILPAVFRRNEPITTGGFAGSHKGYFQCLDWEGKEREITQLRDDRPFGPDDVVYLLVDPKTHKTLEITMEQSFNIGAFKLLPDGSITCNRTGMNPWLIWFPVSVIILQAASILIAIFTPR